MQAWRTRREVLKAAGAGGLVLTFAGCRIGDSGSSGDDTATLPGTHPDAGLPAFVLDRRERADLSAAVARLIPAEGSDDWSAADAGAVEYIEQLLNAFSDGGPAKIYAGGPTRAEFDDFIPLTRIKTLGWQAAVRRLRALYREGLADLDRRARGPLGVTGTTFADLPGPAQDLILTELDLAGTEFFAHLYAHTMEGVYSHPVYGGNKDYIGWRSVCYQGDVIGVRYPSGAPDPDADDRPWDKFGGYAPAEMIRPGGCPGQGPVT